MTLASLQEGFGFLRTRGFYAPLFGASHHHRGVIGLSLSLGLGWHGERMNPESAKWFRND